MRISRIAAALSLSLVVACQGNGTEVLGLKSETDATEIMVSIAHSVQDCWFRSKDSAFTGYRLANEVNSPAGRPRLLLVPKSQPDALPLLVIQAERKGGGASGRFTDIQTYGPLLSSAYGGRITSDVKRWAGGASGCA